ncbi:GntR family transcriptional regulator [Spongorhabdus nitratireducens]
MIDSNGSIVSEKVKVGTQSQGVLDTLIRDITLGDLPQGSRVSEPELSRRYGIGRGPLREAILRLEGMGLVIRAPHVGARVVTLTRTELSEIFAVREALEGMAARLAAENMTDQELGELEQLLETHAAYIEEHQGQAYIDQNGDYDFHYRIITGSRNQRLIRSLCDELYHLMQMYRKNSGSRTRPEQALFEHQMIFKALKDRDGELAEMLMRRHIGQARREIKQFIEPEQQ